MLKEKAQILFCQHCKSLQKTNNTIVGCWYNPLDEEKRLAFCAANEDAVEHLVNLFKADVDKLTVIDDGKLPRPSEVDKLLLSRGFSHTATNRDLYLIGYKQGKEAQLQDSKKYLLDLMGE